MLLVFEAAASVEATPAGDLGFEGGKGLQLLRAYIHMYMCIYTYAYMCISYIHIYI